MNQEIIQSVLDKVSNWSADHQDFQFPPSLVPIAVSARHCHLSEEALEKLFGVGYELTIKSYLSQPGQYASNETVTIAGPKGVIQKVRVLGPSRNLTQVEVSKTDSIKLGLNPPLRKSGDIKGSSPITIIGPKGSLYLPEGLIIAQAHIHMTPDDAKHFNVKNNELVRIKIESERPVTFENIVIRVSERYSLEMHIDTDEANAAFINGNQKGRLEKYDKNADLL